MRDNRYQKNDKIFSIAFIIAFLFLAVFGARILYDAEKSDTGVTALKDQAIVLRQHDQGKYLEVKRNGEFLSLECEGYDGCYPYVPGETIALEMWCKHGTPYYIKKTDDNSGEYEYITTSWEQDKGKCDR